MIKALRYPVRFVDGIIDRVFTVLGAVALSQFPQFYGQYMQRLGGHLSEAKKSLDLYIEAAAGLELTLEEYIREHLDSASEVFVSTGELIRALVHRVEKLEQSYLALQNATIYNRWLVFFREVDWEIAAGTWNNFVPGIPTTVEGLTYALAGLLLGWGIYTFLKAVITFPFKAVVAKSKSPKKLKYQGKH